MFRSYRRLASERGQGTVEYVALILLVAGVFAAVVSTGGASTGKSLAGKITGEISKQIQNVSGTTPAPSK